MSLSGKVAIVTGGASGIGLGIVQAFLAADIKGITVVDRQSALALASDDRVLSICGDVSVEGTAEEYTAATIEKWGQVDIVVLNAGIEGNWHMLHETPMAEYDQVMAVNARGGVPLISPYTASKFAVRGMACIASQEYGKFGIRVNAICPGFIETPFSMKHPELLDAMKEKASLQRLGSPKHIADAAVFLASDAGEFCTGSTLKVDGGITNWC
ncbi:hypothetical protein CcaverHIS631_0705470 [Cutaneotrichosporon cavernicola]|nr:hypothetical protein CcaverHIS631_0705470 [Cutaneotrichosporon cavernicola]